MSRMSQLHADLSVQASEMGWSSLEDALNAGYEVDYRTGTLVRPVNEELDMAHQEWLNERNTVLFLLEDVRKDAEKSGRVGDEKIVSRAIRFIKASKF